MYKGNMQVKVTPPKKSLFDYSHPKKLSARMGVLTPVLIQEALPGDKWTGSTEILLRLAPLLAPIYDDIKLYVHFFFVPNRLIWKEWQKFITGGRLGTGIDPVNAPVPPYINLKEVINDQSDPDLDLYRGTLDGGLADYMGIPKLPSAAGEVANDYDGCNIDVMPFLVYQRAWYDWYRDRNFYDDAIFNWQSAEDYDGSEFACPSGDLTAWRSQIMTLRVRDYLKDYFHSALPFTQRGVEVLMPLQGTGEVTYTDVSKVYKADGTPFINNLLGAGASATGNLYVDKTGTGSSGQTGRIENIDEVNLTSSDVSINDLRSAIRLQEWLERNAVGGSRYTESIQVHFNVKNPDSRLQRSEFLGGGVIPVSISEVVNTSFSKNQDDDTVPAGNLSGHGVTYGNTNRFRYFAPEHGFIIGIMSIMSKPSYFQGLPRMFRRATFLDYPWPTFAHLGEQEVHKWELVANSQTLKPDNNGNYLLFGYQSRYADWKQAWCTNHGDFRSTLLFWTLANKYDSVIDSPPELNAEFLHYDTTVPDRIFAVSGGDQFWCYISNNLKVVRPLPYFGTPTL